MAGQRVHQGRVPIPTGNGSNCEAETAYIYRDILRASVSLVHMNDILRKPSIIGRHHILDLVGGFADGDHIHSGKIQANRLRFGLGDELQRFISDGKLGRLAYATASRRSSRQEYFRDSTGITEPRG